MPRSNTISIASLALLVLAGVTHVSLANIDNARRAAKIAELRVASNDFRAALQSLAAVDCKNDQSCQTLVDFTYAWVYESWAAAAPGQRRARLTRALDYYARARKASPRNTQILTNLALVARQLDDFKTAAQALTDVIKLESDNAYENYLFLGEVLQASGDNPAAEHTYLLAIRANPNDARGHQHLIEIYRKSGAWKNLFKHSMQIRRSFPELAAAGFEYTIGNFYQTDANTAGLALILWTATRADLGALSSTDLETLPATQIWDFAGMQQLRDVVTRTGKPPSQSDISWWEEDAVREDAMARLLRLKANQQIALAEQAGIDEHDRARAHLNAIAYLTAAVKLAPQYYRYLEGELVGSSNAKLDAATSLVTLHHSLKAAGDPMGLSGISKGELEEMTQVLFDGKGGAYAAGQLSDIQNYHTVLGMIYFETRRDQSSGADNATFQLTHALRTAERIANRNPEKYEPLPELRALLATVYERQGKTKESAHELLLVAMGFLEKDNLPKASAALSSAQQGGVDTAAVATTLQGRQAVLSQGADLLKQAPGSNVVKLDSKINWLENPDALNLPKKFIEGQMFKTLADLGAQLVRPTDKALAASINRLALDAASKNRVLTSPTDIKRIQQLETNIINTGTQPQALNTIQIEGRLQPSPAPVEKPDWTLPTQQGSVQIQIAPRVLDKNRFIQDKEINRKNLKLDNKNLQLKPELKE
jgi:tetratricopeptide (TPR) repeat protein